MSTTAPIKILPLAQYYPKMAQPFRPSGTTASYSTLQARRSETIPVPLFQAGPVPCQEVRDFLYSEVAIAYIPNAVVTRTGAVIVDNQWVIQETLEGTLESNGLGPEVTAETLARSPSSDEVIINANRLGMWNYSLFLLEVAPMLLLTTMVPGLETLRAKVFYQAFMAKADLASRAAMFGLFGFPPERIAVADQDFTRHAGVVLFKLNDPHRTKRLSQMLAPTCAVLRQELCTPSDPGARRIYISREAASSRKVSNYPDVLDVLSRHQVTPFVLEGMPLATQVDLFSKADLVVAEHGAGLANIAFMRPGSFVVELLPEPLATRMVYRYIAAHGRLNYCYGTTPVAPGWQWHKDDLAVPPELYNGFLKQI